ncbi:hypothetical protein CFI10_12805 [Marinobacterium iners]|uniref:hypothetical protein n=1 Tax=Marinobacterium iners TaxID=48076 RepID=UPI001A8FEF81|nr:hypothetical protein [Marinobacterium iners]QSR35866.1 hypothetical protein CFI10_12805 [Marinobacterium iners]
MSFTRTNSGLSNGHLFFDTELIIYTEGGDRSFSIDDVENGRFGTKSIDIKFWKGLFDAAKFRRKVQFRSLGSKTASKQIRDKIITKEIKNVALVLDRDLDFITNPPVESPFILHTKGYSWENDVYTEINTINQIKSILLDQELPKEIKEEVSSAYADFLRISRRLLRVEVIFRSQGIKFITEIKGDRFFDNKRSSKINKIQVINFIKKQKVNLKNRPVNMNFDLDGVCPINNNYGKLLAALSVTVINFIVKRNSSLTSIPTGLLESAMLERYINKQISSCDSYYEKIISQLESA